MKKQREPDFYPVALTIAGSDSGGGAGIQADLRTFNAFAVYGCSAITAVTAQNPEAVTGVEPLSPAAVTAQLRAVTGRLAIRAAKTGMLANREIVEAVAAFWRDCRIPLVVDPVMVSTSGAALLKPEAVTALQRELLPQATWLTPNLPEAELLLGRKLRRASELRAAARECAERFGCRVLLKSGHLEGEEMAVDYVWAEGRGYLLRSPRLPEVGIAAHGTGCTLSAALTAGLAAGLAWPEALKAAKTFVLGSLAEPVMIGDRLPAMYPPELDYSEEVSLDPDRE